ncbi:hypothetical protein AVEN_84221-1 [Araneus ventricosus]|uniref:Uncharacterized protein n=1 Tax=Araneus ventricosus TaxID=182803 RepID=A0A4Y2L3L9_ARAVE|nr:hypothetical protein AVEN_84221-1 [Araneus ventricosus]
MTGLAPPRRSLLTLNPLGESVGVGYVCTTSSAGFLTRMAVFPSRAWTTLQPIGVPAKEPSTHKVVSHPKVRAIFLISNCVVGGSPLTSSVVIVHKVPARRPLGFAVLWQVFAGALGAVVRPFQVRTLRSYVSELLELKAQSRLQNFTVLEGNVTVVQVSLCRNSFENIRVQRKDPLFSSVLAFTAESDRNLALRQAVTLPESADPFCLFIPASIFSDRNIKDKDVRHPFLWAPLR